MLMAISRGESPSFLFPMGHQQVAPNGDRRIRDVHNRCCCNSILYRLRGPAARLQLSAGGKAGVPRSAASEVLVIKRTA